MVLKVQRMELAFQELCGINTEFGLVTTAVLPNSRINVPLFAQGANLILQVKGNYLYFIYVVTLWSKELEALEHLGLFHPAQCNIN